MLKLVSILNPNAEDQETQTEAEQPSDGFLIDEGLELLEDFRRIKNRVRRRELMDLVKAAAKES